MANETRSEKGSAILSWSFPATYLLHIAEEYWGGGGFSAYLARARGINLPPSRFLLMNMMGLALMALGVVLARRFRFSQWYIVCLGAVVLGNGLSHSLNGALAREYNPGLITGLLIWIPLGSATLLHLRSRMAARRYWGALLIGAVIQAVVIILALGGGDFSSLWPL